MSGLEAQYRQSHAQANSKEDKCVEEAGNFRAIVRISLRLRLEVIRLYAGRIALPEKQLTRCAIILHS